MLWVSLPPNLGLETAAALVCPGPARQNLLALLDFARLTAQTSKQTTFLERQTTNHMHVLFIAISLMACAPFTGALRQESTNREGYKKWTKRYSCLRVGLGTQQTFFSEVGFSRLTYTYNDLGFAATDNYVALEWVPPILPLKPKSIYGLKAGWEANARALAVGLELKYQTDLVRSDLVLTPRIGFGAFCIVNLFYGYNVSFAGSPFASVGHHQFTVVGNVGKGLLRSTKK